MTLWFLRGLRRGVVTTRYPRQPDPSVTLLPTPPAFRARLLTPELAEELVSCCPSGALQREPGGLRYDVGACTTSGRCRQVAGRAVIPSGMVELAALDREHLVKHIPVGDGGDG
jgi:hypothetical protein